MALFNHLFPYSNLHDINLDWIISIIESIDPAVIQALQELNPDIIEQVNQKVTEAQAAAIAAQSSASEANTARENAATSAAEAAQDATAAAQNATAAETAKTAAETAKTAVENSLVPVISTATAVAGLSVDINRIARTGKTAICYLSGSLSIEPSSDYFTNIFRLPEDFNTANNEQFFTLALVGDTLKTVRFYGRDIAVESSSVATHPAFKMFGATFPIN